MYEPNCPSNVVLMVYGVNTIICLQGSVYSLFLHDCIYMYSMAADTAIKQGYHPRNGTIIFNIAKHISFQGEFCLYLGICHLLKAK